MIEVVVSKQSGLEPLCEAHDVRRLALSGSAVREGASDLDFLIDTGDDNARMGRRLMAVLAGLERLFGDNIMCGETGGLPRGARADSGDPV